MEHPPRHKPTARASGMPPFLVMDVLEEAQRLERAGRDIVHLEIGEPDFETPAVIREAAVRALEEGATTYTHSQGLLELREAIAAHYAERYGAGVSPERVVVTSGTSPAIFLALAALLEPGDEVILSNPTYACYANTVEFCGGRPVFVRVTDERGYQLDAEDVSRAISPRTRAIFVNSPANPTGATLSRATLAALAALADRHGLALLSDEIYHGLVYEGEEVSALEVHPGAFVFNGFSKAYAMTGWRLGYVIAPEQFVRSLQKVQQNLFICAAHFVQRAGIAALTSAAPEVAAMRAEYDRRRRFLVPALRRLGFSIVTEPRGAFYVFANYRQLLADTGFASPDIASTEFARQLLHEAGVAVAPGIDFGTGGEGFVRFSYAASMDALEEAVRRLEALFASTATEEVRGS